MIGCWRDAQTLSAFWHCGVIDRLNVNTKMLHQIIADKFAFRRIPHNHWDNVALIGDMGDACLVQTFTGFCHALLVARTLQLAGFQMPDRSGSTRCNCWRQGCCEDKS